MSMNSSTAVTLEGNIALMRVPSFESLLHVIDMSRKQILRHREVLKSTQNEVETPEARFLNLVSNSKRSFDAMG